MFQIIETAGGLIILRYKITLVFLSLKYCYFRECFIDNGERIEDKFKNSDKSQISRQGEAVRRDEEEGRTHLSNPSWSCQS